MTDTLYLIFLIVGLFSIVLGAWALLLPKTLTVWEQRLLRKLRLISESKKERMRFCSGLFWVCLWGGGLWLLRRSGGGGLRCCWWL